MTLDSLSFLQRRILLYNELIADGADSLTADSVVENTLHPIIVLKRQFGYTDVTAIIPEQLELQLSL